MLDTLTANDEKCSKIYSLPTRCLALVIFAGDDGANTLDKNSVTQ